jgi:hypothetical protein
MSNLIPEFAHVVNRFTIPHGLAPEEQRLFLGHVEAINLKFFGDEELYGDGYYMVPDVENSSVAQKIVEVLKKLCDTAGIPAYIGKDIGCWHLGIVQE